MARKLKHEQQYQFARELWDQGDVEGAEAAYRKLLRKNSTDSGVLYDLGVMLLQKGAAAEAAEYLRKASLLLPKFAPVFNNLGLAQQMANIREEALASFARAIEIEHDYTSALFNRAMLNKEMKNWVAALSDIESVLHAKPNDIDAIVARGQVLTELMRYDEALTAFKEAMERGASEQLIFVDIGNVYFAKSDSNQALEYYDRTLVVNPKNAKALYQKALIFMNDGDTEAAIEMFKKSAIADTSFAKAFLQAGKQLLLKERWNELAELLSITTVRGPETANIYMLKARTLALLDRYHDAIDAFNIVLETNPHNIAALTEKSYALRQLERNEEAKGLLEQVLAIHPNDPVVMSDLGSLLREQGNFEAAFTVFNRAIFIDRACPNAWSNKGQALFDQGKWEEALEHYQHALELMPDSPICKLNIGLSQLLQENFVEGWKGYEWRLQAHKRSSTILDPEVKDLLNGYIKHSLKAEHYYGKKVLLVEEQGVGDRIMFASVIPNVLGLAKSVTILTTERLTQLYQRSFPGIQTVLKEDLDPKTIGTQFDVIVLLGSLCFAFRQSVESFPRTPYLLPSKQKALAWRLRINEPNKKLIGVSWRGGATHLNRTGRSLAISDFCPILTLDDVLLVNLQFGDTNAEIAALENTTGRKIISFDQKELYDLDNLTALIYSLDRVITVQNTNVHICGAIGTHCDALLPQVPEWRYGINANQMRWYGSVYLHRRDANTNPVTIIQEIARTI